jgi:hypothetical protein
MDRWSYQRSHRIQGIDPVDETRIVNGVVGREVVGVRRPVPRAGKEKGPSPTRAIVSIGPAQIAEEQQRTCRKTERLQMSPYQELISSAILSFVSDQLGASPYAWRQRLPLTVDLFVLLASVLDDLPHVGIGGGHDVRDALVRDRTAP